MRCMAHYFSTIIGPSACAFNALHSALPRSQLQQSKPKMIVTIVWASEWILRLQLQLFSLTASCRCKGIRRNLASGCPHVRIEAAKRERKGQGEWGMGNEGNQRSPRRLNKLLHTRMNPITDGGPALSVRPCVKSQVQT